jgi:signal transduction histidine kinase/ActR/RegA family two-component response regulator
MSSEFLRRIRALQNRAADTPALSWRRSIGYRFILYIVLFSSLVTFFSTGVQLYFEYQRDLKTIDANFGQIERSHLKSFSEGLWTFNERTLRVQLQGVLDLPDVGFVEIRKDGASFLAAGTPVTGRAIREEFPLHYMHRGQEMQLGTLVVVAGLDEVYARLLDRVVVILVTQGVKTFFVSAFIFFLFYLMVGRHLKTMAAYAGSLSLDRLASPLVIQRPARHADKDEIGLVVEAINRMRQTLMQDFAVNRQAERTVQMLAESAAGLTGQELFGTIVRNLCEYLGCECAILGRLHEGETIMAMAMVLDGKMVPGYSCALPGSPFEDVSRKGYCVFSEHVAALYPEDRTLAALGAEGYAGIPLLGRNKEPLGILCGISRRKLEPPARTKDIMQILQARAVAELERLQADEERERMEVLLQQARKMEAIGTLAGGIAHDFNNILTPIIGYTELALLQMPEQERAQWNVDEVMKAALRAKNLVQQILTFSRQREQERVTLFLQLIIKENIKLLRASLPATIEIRLDIDPDCGPVSADLTQIQQVVMNLCTNAFHAMEETGGVLEVNLREVVINGEQQFLHEQLAPGRYACLAVGDSGMGMERATRERIFEPYFTTKAQGKGTGLGLALVHGIVKAHRGRIDVYSEKGQGSVFKIYLPVVTAEEPREQAATGDVAVSPPRGTETILLVDDEEQIVKMSGSMLRHLGYSVVGLTDSEEALRIFAETPGKFDLVITDQTMPGLTGGELAARLLEIRPEILIILCTGFSEQMTEERAKTMGIRDYIMKPLTLHDLAFRIRTVLDRDRHG